MAQEESSIENVWSIVTAISCIFLLMISHGISFSVAPLVVEWLETFDEGQAKTGWVGSVHIAIMFMTGL